MTPEQEAAIWRRIGEAFELFSITKQANSLTYYGLCKAMSLCGLPSYGNLDSRIKFNDSHGETSRWGEYINDTYKAAEHRALTAYLMAEMVLDGLAPEMHYDGE